MNCFNISIWKPAIAQQIAALQTQLVGVDVVKSKGEDTTDVATKVKAITLGRGKMAHIPLCVKIPGVVDVKVSEEALQERDFEVFFENLQISFIDSRGNLFFRADGYQIEAMGGEGDE